MQTPRYGCQEFREDSERVIGERAETSIADRYHHHMRGCAGCRRADRLLRAAYLGPILPELGDRQRTREFSAIMRRHKRRPANFIRTGALSAGIAALFATAAVLTLSLVAPNFMTDLRSIDEESSGVEIARPTWADKNRSTIPMLRKGGINRVRTFGRIVAGDARLSTDSGLRISHENLSEGTHFEIDHTDPMQMALVGKILASLEPGSRGDWSKASSSLIELNLDQGMLAVRYDRIAEDPILQVRTPTSIVRVVGTVFTVAVDPAGDTVVSVLRGKVEVLDPDKGHRIAEVSAGSRYDVANSAYGDLGRIEVAAALPLSNQTREEMLGMAEEVPRLADGEIPANWVVPGLSDDPSKRTLAFVMDPRIAPANGHALPPRRASTKQQPLPNQSEDLIAELLNDMALSRRQEINRSLDVCRDLIASPENRFRAANCLTGFMDKYGELPESVEGLLLIGMLRMDFAHDYQSATIYFERFLRRAPEHQHAQLAMYKLVLASIESGRVSEGHARGRIYLERFPDGRYVGLILQRLPALKSAL